MDTPHSSSEQNSFVESADLSGTTIFGQANVTARDIIGRDKIIHGDEYIGYSAAQVSVLLDKIRTEYQSKPFDGHSPYIGLASFQERDADKFFGRETLTAELVTRVQTSAASNARAVFVAGPSGSGKSSLVRAGLVPALKKGQVAGSEHWLYETLKPGRAPLDELARVVSSFANSPDAGDDLRAHALNDAERLHRWADIALKDDANRRAVLVIDQFEEIFTQLATDRENERVAFLQQLTHAATVENGRVIVLFTLRSDFVSNCASYPNLNALVNQQFIQVGAMTPDELVSAIARPAYQVGLRIDPALISQIVNDVRGEPGALPLMQFALQDLFGAEKSKGELTLDGYLARGGLHQALERHADAEFAKLGDAEKQLARSVFGGLVEIGRGREDTKRTALFGELVPAGANAERVQALVLKLADEKVRLITTDEQDGKETVTLAHERLIDAWDWLRRLVDENRDAIALQNEIAQDAQEWETHHRDESYLYRGARLATAREKLEQNQLVLSGLAQEFVDAAIQARERERAERQATRQRELEQAQTLAAEQKQRAEEQLAANKRLRQRNLFLAGAFVLALIAVFAALFFLGQSNEQRDAANRANATSQSANSTSEAQANARGTAESNALAQAAAAQKAANERATAEAKAIDEKNRAQSEQKFSRSRELAAISVSQLEVDPQRALLIAIAADQVEHTFESEDAVRRAIESSYLNESFTGTKRFFDAEFSPDGKHILTANESEPVRLWDTATHQILTELNAYESPVVTASFSPDGTLFVTASSDNTARIWDTNTGNELKKLSGHEGDVRSAQFSQDGKKIVTAGCEKVDRDGNCIAGTVRLWDALSGEQIAISGDFGDVKSAQFADDDGARIVTAGYDYRVRVLDAQTLQTLLVLDRFKYGVTSATFSHDGKRIVTSSLDNTARVWDAVTGNELGVLIGHENDVLSATFSRDDKYIVTASIDTTARVWDATTFTEIAVLRGHKNAVRRAKFSRADNQIITASWDGSVKVWDITRINELPILLGHTETVRKAQFSHDGAYLITSSIDNTARIWDTNTGQELRELSHTQNIYDVQFSYDDKYIVTASEDHTARIWDAKTGQQLASLGHQDIVWSAAFSHDSKYVVTASRDKTLRIWDAVTGKEVHKFQAYTQDVTDAEFSNDDTLVVTASLDLKGVVWDAHTFRQIAKLEGHTGNMRSASFSPDSKLIVTAGEDNTARVWSVRTGKEIGTLREHSNYVQSAHFSSDGKYIVTASHDNTARVWDAETFQELFTIYGHEDDLWDAQFSFDGRYVVTAGGDNTARVHFVRYEEVLAHAKKRAKVKLTCEERRQFLREVIVCPTPTP